MAKGPRSAGKTVMRTVGGGKGKRPEVPVNTAPSDPVGDKQATMLHYGLLTVTVLAVAGLLGFGGMQIYTGVTAHPINWVAVVVGIGLVVGSFIAGRSLAWLSFIGPIMLAANKKAWQTQERLCRQAAGFSKVFAAGGSTAALLLVQSLVSRGQYDEALEIGEKEYATYGNNPKFADNLGPLYSALGMAQQMRGEMKQSIVWNDRAIEAFEKSLESFATKKTLTAKLMGGQTAQLTSNIRMQLAVTYFNNATSQFNSMNHRAAKSSFQKSYENAQKAPDFPEKQQMMSVIKEQMQRLKHV